jgi:hypothetical protein
MAKDDGGSGGCSAETRECDGGAGWGPGMGGGGGGPGPMPGGGGAGPGGGGSTPGHVPGTGCHPDSLDFRDIDNWRHARWARIAFEMCQAAGGSARLVIRAPQASGEEYRVEGVECGREANNRSVLDHVNTPTTLECYNRAWSQ